MTGENKTLVEHWFRKDNCFSIPDENNWFKLKEMFDISTNEFDKFITEFEVLDGVYEKANRIYDENGICPTLTTVGVPEIVTYTFPEKQELKLRLKDMLEEVVDEKYYLSDETMEKLKSYGYEQATRTNDVGGVCNTITTMGGGHREPKIQVTKNYLQYDLTGKGHKSQDQRAYYENGIHGTLPSTGAESKCKVLIKNATKKGYLEATDGDGIDTAYPESETRRGRVQPQRSHTVTTSDNLGVVIDKNVKPSVSKNFEREKEQIALSDKEIYQAKCESGWQDNKVGLKISHCLRANNNNTFGLDNNFRIRKLTPLECWRLMGFDDGDFYKAEKVNSNSQLYKQAGNSICVQVLEAIFKNLFNVE